MVHDLGLPMCMSETIQVTSRYELDLRQPPDFVEVHLIAINKGLPASGGLVSAKGAAGVGAGSTCAVASAGRGGAGFGA